MHDLEALHAQVCELAVDTRNVHLDISVNDTEWARLLTSGWLDQLVHAGVSVRRCTAEAPDPSVCRSTRRSL